MHLVLHTLNSDRFHTCRTLTAFRLKPASINRARLEWFKTIRTLLFNKPEFYTRATVKISKPAAGALSLHLFLKDYGQTS